MAHELYQILRSRKNDATTELFLSKSQVQQVAAEFTKLMCKSLQEQQHKNNPHVTFLRTISREHRKKQCINTKNVEHFLKYLPIATETQFQDDLLLPTKNPHDYINEFFMQNAKKFNARQEIKDGRNIYIQSGFKPGFDYVPNDHLPIIPFSLKDPEDDDVMLVDCNSVHQEQNRIKEIQFAMAIINMYSDKPYCKIIIGNVIEKLKSYELLISEEIEFIKYLIKNDIEEDLRSELVQSFKFLVEDLFIQYSKYILQEDKENVKFKEDILKMINNDSVLKCKAMDICHALFALSKHNLRLMQIMMNIFE